MASVKPIILHNGLPRQMQVGDFVSIANGGTGAASTAGALNNLLPPQNNHASHVLLTDGQGNVTWSPTAAVASATAAAAGDNTDLTSINGVYVGTGVGSYADNVVLGLGGLTGNTTGSGNTAVGYNAMLGNTTGTQNIAMGGNALMGNTTGYGNVAVGAVALDSNTTGYNNIGVGLGSLASNTTGFSNTAVGFNTLAAGATTFGNTAIGASAGSAITTGSYNVIIGGNTGAGIATMSNNVIISNGLGDVVFAADSFGRVTLPGGLVTQTMIVNDITVGRGTGAFPTNTAIGVDALLGNTTGTHNTALGHASLLGNTAGYNNTSIGLGTLTANTTGHDNVALGNLALSGNTTGHYNTSVGSDTLLGTTTGVGNVAFGYSAGSLITTGSYNVIIGGNVGETIATLSNHVIISDGVGAIRVAVDNLGLVSLPGGLTTPSIIGMTTALSVLQGGTGETTTTSAFTSLAPPQLTNAGKVLTTNGTTASWEAHTNTAIASGTVVGSNGGVVDLVFGTTSSIRSGSLTTTTINPTVIDRLSSSVRTSKYIIQVVNANTGNVHATELTVTRTDANVVLFGEHNTLTSNGALATFTAVYNGTSHVEIIATAASAASTQYKFSATVMSA